MDGKDSKKQDISSKVAIPTTTSSNANCPKHRNLQNFLLIWVDANIDQSNQDCQNTLTQLRSVVNDVNIFTRSDECVDFLTDIGDMKAFMIIESTLAEQIVHLIHDIPQLDTVYILRADKSGVEQWVNKWIDVKNVHTEIASICDRLQQDVKQCNRDSIAMSFVTVNEGASSQNLDQLEPSFMYTQIFKEILLEMKHNEISTKDFIRFWRHHYTDNAFTLKIIDQFERTYSPQSSIRWYTCEYFIYQMLNQALRTLKADIIINMGFFVRDLHHRIDELYQKQISSYGGKSFVVYRGQGLSTTDFEKLLKTRGGLMSFNNFLSTTKDREVSLCFAESVLTKTNTVGILFKMTINPSVSSAPFASLQDVSEFQAELEILFSMHTVFRIGEIKKIDKNNLYQVDLELTADDDQQLRILTDRIRDEIPGKTGWERLGLLLVKIGPFDKAEELYKVLLEQTSDEGEKAANYNNLGYIKYRQGDYEKTIWYYEKALEIHQKTLPSNHPGLATPYNNIGTVYYNMGEHSKALSFYEKALEIFKKTLSSNHPHLAAFYNNIGEVYCSMGEYSKALSSHEKALEIYQKTLPPNHPDLASSYDNIASVCKNMGKYSKALSSHEKALEIYQKTLPPNHPDLATSYNNMGGVYSKMGKYSKALSFYEKDLEISQKTLPPNHPHLAASYNNIGGVYNNMGEYSKTSFFFEKALEISQKTLPPNHPDLATSYNNIASVYMNMREYSKALSYLERAQDILQRSLPANHPCIKTVQNNIGALRIMKMCDQQGCQIQISGDTLILNL